MLLQRLCRSAAPDRAQTHPRWKGAGLSKEDRIREGERRHRGVTREEEGCAHITGQFFIVLHQLLVLLVDRQYFADPVGRRLSLDGEERESVRAQTRSLAPSRRTNAQLEVQHHERQPLWSCLSGKLLLGHMSEWKSR